MPWEVHRVRDAAEKLERRSDKDADTVTGGERPDKEDKPEPGAGGNHAEHPRQQGKRNLGLVHHRHSRRLGRLRQASLQSQQAYHLEETSRDVPDAWRPARLGLGRVGIPQPWRAVPSQTRPLLKR